MLDKLKALCELNGTSGDESRVREYIKDHITADEVFTEILLYLRKEKDLRRTR